MNFFSFDYTLREYCFCIPPPPEKFSNGPSLTRTPANSNCVSFPFRVIVNGVLLFNINVGYIRGVVGRKLETDVNILPLGQP